MKTGIVIQARRSSTRLKDKILMELPAGSGISMLGRVIMRAKKVCDNVILATSDNQDDDLTEQEEIAEALKLLKLNGMNNAFKLLERNQ